MRVLLVSGDVEVANVLETWLKLRVDVDVSRTVEEAEAVLGVEHYGFIVADDEHDSDRIHALLQWLREHQPRCRRVLLSTSPPRGDIVFERCFLKPYELEALVDWVHEHKENTRTR